MLLLLKTNDCLRHIDGALGVPINTAIVIGNTTAEVIFKEELRLTSGVGGVVTAVWRYFRMMLRVSGLQVLSKYLKTLSVWVARYSLPEWNSFLFPARKLGN